MIRPDYDQAMQSLMFQVAAFHHVMGQPNHVAFFNAVPAVPPADRIVLRRALHVEEFNETQAALESGDLAGLADGIADLIYVLLGTALEYGLPLPEVWKAVQRANMAKVDPVTGTVTRNVLGKVMKPAGWTAPDVAAIIQAATDYAGAASRYEVVNKDER